jgi:hypothetical protein
VDDAFRSQGQMRLKVNSCSEVTGEECIFTAITTVAAGVSQGLQEEWRMRNPHNGDLESKVSPRSEGSE